MSLQSYEYPCKALGILAQVWPCRAMGILDQSWPYIGMVCLHSHGLAQLRFACTVIALHSYGNPLQSYQYTAKITALSNHRSHIIYSSCMVFEPLLMLCTSHECNKITSNVDGKHVPNARRCFVRCPQSLYAGNRIACGHLAYNHCI